MMGTGVDPHLPDSYNDTFNCVPQKFLKKPLELSFSLSTQNLGAVSLILQELFYLIEAQCTLNQF